uniref:Glycosyl transferase family 2 n=1 Tax=Methanococcus maripaludis (strain C6 / ATCC BAA-1332) TaxID=444158 RepID=A9A6X3_METM6
MENPQVSIIILNWNGWEDTIECLESLYRINYPNYNVVLIDNGSIDESIEKIKEYCDGKIEVNSKFFKYSFENKPLEIFEISEKDARNNEFSKKEEFLNLKNDKKLLLIKNEDNYGFAGGNNVGMKFAIECLNSDYVLLLNNDTVVDENFLTEMVKVGESDEKIGIVGSKIYYYDYDGRDNVVWALGGGGVNLQTGVTWHYCKNNVGNDTIFIKNMGYITGCSMLLNNELLKKLNGFDENYFCYYEDTDISIRSKKLGYLLAHANDSKVWHKVSATSGGKYSKTYLYYLTRNRIYFVKKNMKIYYITSVMYALTIDNLLKLRALLSRKLDIKSLKHFYKGIFDAMFKI